MPMLVVWVTIFIIIVLLFIFFAQEKLFFKPEKLKQNFKYKYDAPFEELFFNIEEGVSINGLHFYKKNPKGLILYFHGNSRSIKGWAKYAKDFYRYDYDVVLVDYRGFGKSTGKRSEENLHSDMQFVYNKLKEKYNQNHLIIYGRSMGSGFATKLAAENNPRYLILDAPYYSFRKVVERFIPILPINWVLRYHLRTDQWIGKVKCPIYILHGTKDRLIPISQSEQLQKLNSKRITLIEIEGGKHNNLPTFHKYHNFIRDILQE